MPPTRTAARAVGDLTAPVPGCLAARAQPHVPPGYTRSAPRTSVRARHRAATLTTRFPCISDPARLGWRGLSRDVIVIAGGRVLRGAGPVRMTWPGWCLPARCYTLRGDSGARILGRAARAAPCSDGVYGGVAGLPHGRAYGVGSGAGQAGDAVAGGGLGYR